jgi:hypothetical protein
LKTFYEKLINISILLSHVNVNKMSMVTSPSEQHKTLFSLPLPLSLSFSLSIYADQIIAMCSLDAGHSVINLITQRSISEIHIIHTSKIIVSTNFTWEVNGTELNCAADIWQRGRFKI